ncbi:MAG: phosphate signaling complex protein PhoU [Acetobacter sp.]|jgi:phosphate transport system protein|nr:phosphate signaling complex protein PhoU [Acetobacter sp.]MCH4062366.1 phosphate signaling complex protein PhoU [Acetobacter sp.]MCH4088787.1 phosphate signaling complex protein PhoU [Acetobacter sp.]MCI1292692.1 phosphate signaling complex protein PhoU [Acetobacter sp.]MCI1319208.1 phosphate signaling complex protein PhoU [Acetobacter sp.]
MSDPTQHTVKSYEQELELLKSIMARMGGLVERQTALAIKAIVERNEEAAIEAPELDPEVDELEREAEMLAIRILALRSPMAVDLREIVAALKITGDLERIGDYASSISRRSLKLDSLDGNMSMTGLKNMGRLVQDNLRRVIDALTQRNRDLAIEVWQADTAVDELYTAMFRELMTYMMEDPRYITSCIHLLFVAKHIERIGDHTTNIAERVYYAVTGQMLPSERPRGGLKTQPSE